MTHLITFPIAMHAALNTMRSRCYRLNHYPPVNALLPFLSLHITFFYFHPIPLSVCCLSISHFILGNSCQCQIITFLSVFHDSLMSLSAFLSSLFQSASLYSIADEECNRMIYFLWPKFIHFCRSMYHVYLTT